MVRRSRQALDWETLIEGVPGAPGPTEYGKNRDIFRQGDRADSLFYLRRGRVRLGVRSGQGKEATVAVLSAGQFFGEGCLAGQPRRMATATAASICILMRIKKPLMVRMLHEHQSISEMFATLLLARNLRYEEDLLGQIFNSCEKRLARVLLLLAHYDREPRTEAVFPGINQVALARKVGITRMQVSHVLNKFKKLGFIDYEAVALKINSSLLSVVLND